MTFLIIILLIFWGVSSPDSLFVIVIIGIFSCVVGLIVMFKNTRDQKESELKIAEEEAKFLERLIKENNIPLDSRTIIFKRGHPLINKNSFNAYIWLDNKILCFFDKSQIDNIGKVEIPVHDIDYYDIKGDVHRETKISGGGISGGGSSMGGAVTGGLLAGGAGAVVGSRKKVKGDPIFSETITHDERETFLNLILNGERKSIFFNYKTHDILLDLIPEKSYKNIHNNYIISQSNDNQSKKITDQIKDLSNLKNEGILTEDEFQQKKIELLSKI